MLRETEGKEPVELDGLCKGHGADKPTAYLGKYENIFSLIQAKPLKILEIGVQRGGSLRAWSDYFYNAKIVGVDIDPKTKFSEDRIVVEIGDSVDYRFMERVREKHGPFDIVIDDGGHTTLQMIKAFEHLFPLLNPGGYYVIEDMGTQGHADWGKPYRDMPGLTVFDFLGDVLRGINIGPWQKEFVPSNPYKETVEWILFYPNLCFAKRKS
jgi:cephalosporin hydroxylase